MSALVSGGAPIGRFALVSGGVLIGLFALVSGGAPIGRFALVSGGVLIGRFALVSGGAPIGLFLLVSGGVLIGLFALVSGSVPIGLCPVVSGGLSTGLCSAVAGGVPTGPARPTVTAPNGARPRLVCSRTPVALITGRSSERWMSAARSAAEAGSPAAMAARAASTSNQCGRPLPARDRASESTLGGRANSPGVEAGAEPLASLTARLPWHTLFLDEAAAGGAIGLLGGRRCCRRCGRR